MKNKKTNIYLCTLDNGQSYDDYQDNTITVTAKDEDEENQHIDNEYLHLY